MFSVTYTGINFLPLCTAIVWPTNSGRMVERRDQVRTTFFSFDVLSTATLASRCVSVNGPFLTERPISLRKKSKGKRQRAKSKSDSVGGGRRRFPRAAPRRGAEGAIRSAKPPDYFCLLTLAF